MYRLDIKQPVSSIILHAESPLQIDTVKYCVHSQSEILHTPVTFRLDRDLKQLILELTETISPSHEDGEIIDDDNHPGDITLYFEFHGELNENMSGYFKNTYKDRGGEERHFSLTQVSLQYQISSSNLILLLLYIVSLV